MDGWGVERGPGHGPDLPESIIFFNSKCNREGEIIIDPFLLDWTFA